MERAQGSGADALGARATPPDASRRSRAAIDPNAPPRHSPRRPTAGDLPEDTAPERDRTLGVVWPFGFIQPFAVLRARGVCRRHIGSNPGARPGAAEPAPGPGGFAADRRPIPAAAPTSAAVLLALHKPYGVVCQFTDDGSGRPTLATFVDVPGVYPAGRLDHDSEGLVLLTDDGALQHRLTDPRHKQPKTYLVEVERVPTDDALDALRRGVVLRDGPTRPATVRRLPAPPDLPPRDPPVRFRANVPTAWLELTITEGRNRQVRRMTAAVGHPTLRLVRVAVGPYRLGDLAPGTWQREDAGRLKGGSRRPARDGHGPFRPRG